VLVAALAADAPVRLVMVAAAVATARPKNGRTLPPTHTYSMLLAVFSSYAPQLFVVLSI